MVITLGTIKKFIIDSILEELRFIRRYKKIQELNLPRAFYLTVIMDIIITAIMIYGIYELIHWRLAYEQCAIIQQNYSMTINTLRTNFTVQNLSINTSLLLNP